MYVYCIDCYGILILYRIIYSYCIEYVVYYAYIV